MELDGSDLGDITLMSQGDILVVYTEGFYDGRDSVARELLEAVMCQHYREPAKEICNAWLDHAVRQDDRLRQNGDADLIDDKTVFIVKRT